MTGKGRTEHYRGYIINAQAMSAGGGAEHRARVAVGKSQRDWRGPYIDYDSVFATEDEARAHGISLGMEVIDADIESQPCRWRPIVGRWG